MVSRDRFILIFIILLFSTAFVFAVVPSIDQVVLNTGHMYVDTDDNISINTINNTMNGVLGNSFYEWFLNGYPLLWLNIPFDGGLGLDGEGSVKTYTNRSSAIQSIFESGVPANPSFESGSSVDADDWNGETGCIGRTSAFDKWGGDSFQFCQANVGVSYSVSSAATYSLAAGSKYKLGGFIYNNMTGGNVFIDMNDAVGECQPTSTKQAEWEWVECIFTAGATESKSMRMAVDSSPTAGSVWFDNLYLTEIENGYNSTIGNDGLGAIAFDGSNDVFKIWDPDFNETADWTLSAWIYRRADSGQWERVIERVSNCAAGQHPAIGLQVSDGDLLQGYMYDAAWKDVYGNAVPLNEWHHIGLTWDNSNLVLYQNGVETANTDYTGAIPDDWGIYEWFLGEVCEIGSYSNNYNGIIDEFKVYQRALSAEQLSALYNNNTNILVSNETSIGDTWTACATPNNNSADGVRVCSESITSVDATPLSQTYIAPTKENSTNYTGKTVQISINISGNLTESKFNWNGTDTTLYNDSLILMYNFDEVSTLGETSSNIVDMTNYSYNGTTAGNAALSTTAKYGKSLSLDGTDDALSSGVVPMPTEMTVLAWIRNTGGGTDQDILAFGDTGQAEDKSIFRISSTNALQWGVDEFGTGWDAVSGSTTGLNDGNWHFVAMTRTAGGLVEFFIDGLPDGSGTPTRNYVSGTQVVSIGALKNGAGYDNEFTGNIDEVRVWNTILTDETIKQLFNTNLKKTGVNLWELYTNQTKDSTSLLDYGVYTYASYERDNYNFTDTIQTRTINIINSQINFTSPTLPSGTLLSVTDLEINVSIQEVDVDNIIYNWNGVNYTYYSSLLVAMYNFDQISSLGENSTNVVDVSQNSNDGTVSGATWISNGRHDGAYDFDGNNDYIEILEPASILGTDPFAISVWINPDVNNVEQAIILQRDASGFDGEYMLHINSTGKIAWVVYGDTAIQFEFESVSTIPTDTWTHVAVTREADGSGNIYINGELDASSSGVNRNLVSFKTYIGADIRDADNYFDGSIDEVRIWNKSLSEAEVYQQYVGNFKKTDLENWQLYINQSKNATAGLDDGIYPYYAYVNGTTGNENQTETRTIEIDAVDDTFPLVSFVSPTLADGTISEDPDYEINATITEENLKELTYNWNGTNHTTYDPSLVLMYNFDNAENEVINATFSMGTSGNSYHYEDLTSVPDYIIRSGDYLEYDVYWTSANDLVAVDYETSDATALRGSGAVDQNGINSHPGTDMNAYADGKWYHRKIAIPVGHVGKTIAKYMIACERSVAGTYTSYIDNILITDGAGTTRKVVYTNDSFTNAVVSSSSGSLVVLENTTNGPIYIDDKSLENNIGARTFTEVANGKYGKAVSFDGSQQIETASNFDVGTNSFTISTWVNLDSTSESGGFVKIGDSSNGVGIGVGATTFDDTGNDLIVIYESVRWIDTNVPVGTGWHHVAVVVDASGYPEIFLDGTSIYSDTTGAPVSPTDITYIGGYFTRQVDAEIDEVRIWDRSLSAEEISMEYISNLQRLGSDSWELYVNHSNLPYGTYDYGVYAKDLNNNTNQSERSVTIASEPVLGIQSVILNSSELGNTVSENLSANVINLTPANATVIYDWKVNGNSIADIILTFDGDNNTFVRDYTDNNNLTTRLGNIDYNPTAGRDGNGALTLTGSLSSYYYSNGSSYPIGASPRTLSFWTYTTADTNSYYLGYGTNTNDQLWYIGNFAGGTGLLIEGGAGNNWQTSIRPTLNIWEHHVITYNGSIAKWYVDGTLSETSSPITWNTTITATGGFRIGEIDAGLPTMTGTIDDVILFNRALSPEQILALHNNQTNLIVSEETSYGDTWSVCATPNDNDNNNGSSVCSNSHTLESLPLSPLSSDSTATQWNMYRKYLNHTAWDGISYPTIPGLNRVTYTTGSSVYSSPIVVDGSVYVASNDKNLYQLNATDITQKIAQFTMENGAGTPIVVGDYLYIVDSTKRVINQLNATNITQKITEFPLSNSRVILTPAVANGFLYTGSGYNKLLQLNASNISQIISQYNGGFFRDSSPAVAGDFVYIGGIDRKLSQFNATDISQKIAEFTTGHYIYSSPVVSDGYVYVGSNDKKLYQLNATDVSQKIAEFETGSYIYTVPTIANGYLYFSSRDKKLYQLNASNIAQKISEFDVGSYPRSSPVVANGYVYVGSSTDKTLYQLNATDISQVITQYRTQGSVDGSPAIANGYIYFGSHDKKVYQLNATDLSLGNVDLTPPIISFINPTNNSYINGNVELWVTASDDTSVSKVEFYYKNSSVSNTLLCTDYSSSYKCVWDSTTYSNATEGYRFTAIAYDGAGNTASTVINLSIDRTLPLAEDLIVTYPSGQTSVRNNQSVHLSIGVSDADAGLLNATVDTTLADGLGVSSLIFNYGSNSSSQWGYWNKTLTINGSTGNHKLPTTVTDLSTPPNLRISDIFYVIVDNEAPTYTQFQDYGPAYTSEEIIFRVLPSDNYLPDSYIFSSNITGSWINDSLLAIENITEPIFVTKTGTIGNYSYKFYLYDDAGNVNETSVGNFEIYGYRAEFTVMMHNIISGATTANSNVNFTYEYYGGSATNCSLYVDSVIDQTVTSPENNTILYFNKSFTEGTYAWSVECFDPIAGLSTGDDEWIFNVDSIPAVGNLSINPNLSKKLGVVDIEFDVTNSTVEDVVVEVFSPEGDSVNYSYSGGHIEIVNEINNTITFLFKFFNTLADGIYDFIISVFDSAGNVGKTSGSFEVDLYAPTITSGLNATNVSVNDDFKISANVNDDRTVGSVWVSIINPYSATTTYPMSDLGSGNYAYTVTANYTGTYVLTIYANDTAGNIGSLDSLSIISYGQDSAPPMVTHQDYLEYTYIASQDIFARIVDPSSVDTAILEITNPSSSKTNYSMTITGEDQSQINSDVDFNLTSKNYVAQKFSPSKNIHMSKVSLYVGTVVGSGYVDVEIRNNFNDTFAEFLSESSVFVDSSNSNFWIEFTFSDPQVLNSFNSYWILAKTDFENYTVPLEAGTSNPYSDGFTQRMEVEFEIDDPTLDPSEQTISEVYKWNNYSNTDLKFKTYGGNNWYSYNYAMATEGNYTLNVYANDTNGYSSVTNIGWFIVDRTKPTVSTGAFSLNGSSSLVATVSVSDDVLLDYSYVNITDPFGNSNISENMEGITDYTASFPSYPGNFSGTIHVFDEAGNNYTFDMGSILLSGVDSVPPQISNYSVTPRSGMGSTMFNFSVNVIDNVAIDSATLEVYHPENDSIVGTYLMNHQGSGYFTYNQSNFAEGAYGVRVHANDSSGNLKTYKFIELFDANYGNSPTYESNVSFVVDTTAPYFRNAWLHYSPYVCYGRPVGFYLYVSDYPYRIASIDVNVTYASTGVSQVKSMKNYYHNSQFSAYYTPWFYPLAEGDVSVVYTVTDTAGNVNTTTLSENIPGVCIDRGLNRFAYTTSNYWMPGETVGVSSYLFSSGESVNVTIKNPSGSIVNTSTAIADSAGRVHFDYPVSQNGPVGIWNTSVSNLTHSYNQTFHVESLSIEDFLVSRVGDDLRFSGRIVNDRTGAGVRNWYYPLIIDQDQDVVGNSEAQTRRKNSDTYRNFITYSARMNASLVSPGDSFSTFHTFKSTSSEPEYGDLRSYYCYPQNYWTGYSQVSAKMYNRTYGTYEPDEIVFLNTKSEPLPQNMHDAISTTHYKVPLRYYPFACRSYVMTKYANTDRVIFDHEELVYSFVVPEEYKGQLLYGIPQNKYYGDHYASNGGYFDITLPGMGIYENKTFSLSTLGYAGITLDTMPLYDLDSPIVNITSTSVNVSTNNVAEINYTVSDNSNVDNCSLYINGTFNSTDTSISKYVNQYFPFNFGHGTYNVSVVCYDLLGKVSNNATTILIVPDTLDVVKPTIAFSPDSTVAGYRTQDYIVANIEAYDANLSLITTNLYNVTWGLINSTSQAFSPLNLTYSNLTAGVYYVSATAWDARGNSESVVTRTIELDGSPIPPPPQLNSDSNATTWNMFRKYLNHTAWDGVSYPIIPGLNMATYTTGAMITSSPIVINGFAYIGSNDGKLYQLNASDVTQKIAEFTTGGSVQYSTPIVIDEYLYVGSTNRKLYQLNASDITQKIAEYTMNSDVRSSPIIANGSLYITNYNTFLELNASNISQKISEATFSDYFYYSTPAIAENFIYVGANSGKVYQLNAENTSQIISQYQTGSSIYSSPVIANGYLYVGSYDQKLYQLNATVVSQKIAEFNLGQAMYSTPAVANGYVYVGSYNHKLYQLDANDISNKIAEYTTGNYIYASPAVDDNFVYFGSYDNKIYQLDATDVSSKIAEYTVDSYIFSSPAVANGYVYFGSFDKKLYQLKASNISLSNPDLIAPTISYVTPVNNSYVNGNVNLQVSASDAIGVSKVEFYYKNSTVSDTILCTDTSGTSSTYYDCNWDTTIFGDAVEGYRLTAIAYDAAGNTASTMINLSIDRNLPITKDLSVSYPAGQSSVRNGQSIIVSINVTDADAGILSNTVDTTLLDSSGVSSMNFASGSSTAGFWGYWTKTIVASEATGNHKLPITVTDKSDPANIRNSDRFYVVVDNEVPTYTDFQDYGPVYSSEEMVFRIMAYDNYLAKSYVFSTDMSGSWVNDSVLAIENASESIFVTKTGITGTHSYKFYLFDDAGNVNETTAGNFEVYGNRPYFTVLMRNITDGTQTTNQTVDFTYEYTGGYASNCSLYVDSIINQTTATPTNGSLLSFTQIFADGTYSWYVGCVDNSTNISVDGTQRFFTVDSLPVFTSISNITIDYGTPLSSDIDAVDTLGVSCYSVDDITNFDIDCSGVLTNNTVLFPDTYNLNISVTDTGSNTVSESMWVKVNYPVSACVDLSDAVTYSDKIVKTNGIYYVNKNVTLCAGTDISTTTTGLKINVNNLVLNCNGAIIRGDDGKHDIGIDNNGFENVVTQNCYLYDFGHAIKYQNVNSGSMLNNYLYSTRWASIRLTNADNMQIVGNTIIGDWRGVRYHKSHNNNFSNNVVSQSTDRGIMLTSSNGNIIENNQVTDSKIAVDLTDSDNTIMTQNSVYNNAQYGLMVKASSVGSIIYDNLFNNSFYSITATGVNNYNTTLASGTNIIGGSYIGGNFWTNAVGTGFSDTCLDEDQNGICDNKNSIGVNNIDYLALAYADTVAPSVYLKSPADGSDVKGNITLDIFAQDDSGIKNILVEYRLSPDGSYVKACDVIAEPYTCLWDTNLLSNSSGGYDVRLTAFDNRGNNATTSYNFRIDYELPIVSNFGVTYPGVQSSVRDGQTVTLYVSTSDGVQGGSGMNISRVNTTSFDGIGGVLDMNMMSGDLSAGSWSNWEKDVTINATTGSKFAPLYVYDNSTPNNLRQAEQFYVFIDNMVPTYSSVFNTDPVYEREEIAITLNMFDNYDLDSYIFSLNSGSWVNDSAVSISGKGYSSLTLKTLSAGSYEYKFYIFDDAGNVNETNVYNFTILGAGTDFALNIIEPEDNNATTGNIDVTFNYTFGVTHNCTFILNDLINTTWIAPSVDTNINLNQNYADGSYSWRIECYNNDTNEIEESTGRTFIIDSVAPIISFNTPSALNYSESNNSIDISYTETNPLFCWYNEGGENITLPGCEDLESKSFSDGTHTLSVYIEDIMGRIATDSVSFTVDSIPPTISQTVPVGNYYNDSLRPIVEFNCSASDAFGLSNVSLYLSDNTSSNLALNATTAISGTSDSSVWNVRLGNGNYLWQCSAIDLLGHTGWSETRSIIINATDQTAPSVGFAPSTTSGGSHAQANVNVRAIAYDVHLDTINITLYNSTGDLVNYTTQSSSPVIVSYTSLPDGVYYLNATANDTHENRGYSATRIITLDSTAPVVSLVSPINLFNTSASSVDFVFSAIDLSDMTCSLYKDEEGYVGDKLMATNSSVDSGVATTFTVPGMTNRTHQWYVNCTDVAGNSDVSSVRTLTTDQISPVIDIVSPTSSDILGYNVRISTEISDGITSVDTASYFIINSSNSAILASGSLNSSDNWDAAWNSSSLIDAQWNIILNITTNDTVGNSFVQSVPFILDNVNPSVQLIVSPVNLAHYNTNFSLDIYVQDFTLNYTNYSIKNVSDIIVQSNESSYPNNTTIHNWVDLVNISGLSDGAYNLTLYARDAANNTRTTSSQFVVDTTVPVVSLDYPNDTLRTTATDITFAWTPTDNIASSLDCNLSIDGNAVKSDISCASGSACSYEVKGLVWADYSWNVTCTDIATNVNIPVAKNFVPDWQDDDGDEVHTYIDRLIGIETNVDLTGDVTLNITVSGDGNLTTFTDTKEVVFYDDAELIMNFTHNFTEEKLDLNDVTLIVAPTYIITNLSAQLQGSKTLYIDDNNFTGLCVKDAEISVIGDISANCNGAFEVDFDSCIDNGAGVTINGITCTDEGTRFKVENLQYSAILGTVAEANGVTPPSDPPGGSGSPSGTSPSSGGSGYSPACGDNYCSVSGGENCSTCAIDCGVCNATDVPSFIPEDKPEIVPAIPDEKEDSIATGNCDLLGMNYGSYYTICWYWWALLIIITMTALVYASLYCSRHKKECFANRDFFIVRLKQFYFKVHRFFGVFSKKKKVSDESVYGVKISGKGATGKNKSVDNISYRTIPDTQIDIVHFDIVKLKLNNLKQIILKPFNKLNKQRVALSKKIKTYFISLPEKTKIIFNKIRFFKGKWINPLEKHPGDDIRELERKAIKRPKVHDKSEVESYRPSSERAQELKDKIDAIYEKLK